MVEDETGDDRTSIWTNFDALSWWVLQILKRNNIKVRERWNYFFQNNSNCEYVTIVFGVMVALDPKVSWTQARNNGAFQYKLKSIN